MNDRISEIKRRLEAATPGPWEWAEDRINEQNYYTWVDDKKGGQRKKAKYPGALRQSFVYLLKRVFDQDNDLRWNFNKDESEGVIMQLRWRVIGGSCVYDAWPSTGNAELIAHAAEDIAFLLAEVERLTG